MGLDALQEDGKRETPIFLKRESWKAGRCRKLFTNSTLQGATFLFEEEG